MDGGQLKNVGLLSVVCLLSWVRPQLSFKPLVWLGKIFFLQKLEKLCIWEF